MSEQYRVWWWNARRMMWTEVGQYDRDTAESVAGRQPGIGGTVFLRVGCREDEQIATDPQKRELYKAY